MGTDAGDFITPDDYNAELEALQDQVDDINAELAVAFPRGQIGYAEQTSDVLTAGAEAMVFGAPWNVAADRLVGYLIYVRLQGDLGDNIVIRVRLDDPDTGDQVGGGSHTFETNGGAATMTLTRILQGPLAVSVGAHNLYVTQELTAGTGVAGVKGTPEAASTLKVTDEGSAV